MLRLRAPKTGAPGTRGFRVLGWKTGARSAQHDSKDRCVFAWLKKPVEMLNFYPEGIHELVKPQQRLLSQGSVVDWYCFWLKGEEDPDPAKAEQYKRWRELRKQQQANETAARPN